MMQILDLQKLEVKAESESTRAGWSTLSTCCGQN